MKVAKKILLILSILLLVAGGVFIAAGYFNYRSAIREISLDDKVENMRSDPDYITIEDISDDLLKATVSIEDHRFYSHNGVDHQSLARAFVNNICAREIVEGGSTITQQLAKNLYFNYQPSYIRKVSEIFVAYDLEHKFSKDEILELYVNVINYGDGHMGIQEASKGYFNKLPKELNLDEASLLAGLPQSPMSFQLSNHEDDARERQKAVLSAMLRDGEVSQSVMESIIK